MLVVEQVEKLVTQRRCERFIGKRIVRFGDHFLGKEHIPEDILIFHIRAVHSIPPVILKIPAVCRNAPDASRPCLRIFCAAQDPHTS